MARGRVWKRGKTWCIRYDAGVDEATGKRLQPFESGFTSEQEADARLAQRLHEVATGKHVKQSKETFASYAQYWLDVLLPGTVRETSQVRYATVVHRHLIPAFGHLQLTAIRVGHIARYYRSCEAAGRAARTIRLSSACLSRILRSAVKERLLPESVCSQVSPPRIPHTEITVWTAAQLGAFLEMTASEPLGPLWHVSAMTGMRRGEVLGLRWKDIDWARAQIHVRQQVRVLRGEVYFTDLKSQSSRRTVRVGQATMQVLHAHRARQNEARLAVGPTWHEHDLVFPRLARRRAGDRDPGVAYVPENISHRFTCRLRGTGLPTITLHGLRHTHATIMLAEDGNIKALAARLGHDPAVLLRIYAHVLPEHQERAVARFEAALLAAQEEVRDIASDA